MSKTCFPGVLGSTHLRAAAAVGMNRGALRNVAIAVQKLKLVSISVGLTGLLADQQRGFGHGSACRHFAALSHVINTGHVWMRCLPSCAEEMGETCSSSCSKV